MVLFFRFVLFCFQLLISRLFRPGSQHFWQTTTTTWLDRGGWEVNSSVVVCVCACVCVRESRDCPLYLIPVSIVLLRVLCAVDVCVWVCSVCVCVCFNRIPSTTTTTVTLFPGWSFFWFLRNIFTLFGKTPPRKFLIRSLFHDNQLSGGSFREEFKKKKE